MDRDKHCVGWEVEKPQDILGDNSEPQGGGKGVNK